MINNARHLYAYEDICLHTYWTSVDPWGIGGVRKNK